MSNPASSPSVVPFSFESHEIRTIVKDGTPWFVAADICAALGLENVTKSLLRITAQPAVFDLCAQLEQLPPGGRGTGKAWRYACFASTEYLHADRWCRHGENRSVARLDIDIGFSR